MRKILGVLAVAGVVYYIYNEWQKTNENKQPIKIKQ